MRKVIYAINMSIDGCVGHMSLIPPNTKSEIYIPYGSTNGYDHVSVGQGTYHYTIKKQH